MTRAHELAQTLRARMEKGYTLDNEPEYEAVREMCDEVERLAADAERLRDALAEAAVVIEPLRMQDAENPYRELSPAMRAQIVRASCAMRAALKAAE